MDGSEFVVTDGSAIYHTGTSMVVESLKARTGEPVETATDSLSFADENPAQALQQLALAHPGRRTYLTGTLTVDYPEGLPLQPPSRQHQTAAWAGASLMLELHPLKLAMVQLADQWVVGNVGVLVQ